MILAATGHRPDKLGGYSAQAERQLLAFAKSQLALHTPSKIISGMALGWDQAVARAAVSLGIPYVAAIPFAGQDVKWPFVARHDYKDLLSYAAGYHFVSTGGYAVWKLQKRNEWMVDNADCLLALWNGSTGGTANCVKYAQKQQKPLDNVWPAWEKFSALKPETP